MKINILDQSPVIEGSEPSDAIEQTLELAMLGDKLGYHRYWVAEHHSTNSFANASPEILIPVIASQTKNIRIGSGGVLISHYAPIKIAEEFNMLEALYPGRIDLGIGRAPGGDAGIIKAMRTSNEDSFLKTTELTGYLKNSSEGKYTNGIIASPSGTGMPEVWILGTSPDSAMYAAKNGLRYAFGSFINDEHMLQCFQLYYQNFVPSLFLKEAYLNLALFVICGETEEDAKRMAKCSEYWLAQTFLKGRNIKFPKEETALAYNFSIEEKMVIEYRRKSAIIGDADSVSKRLKEIEKKYALHEITLVTIVADHSERKRSYELIANRCLSE
ncbi:MAG: LLM class flavin-dependent oxidoreductase [bacterium]|nr:LLM class flavin-dependent oxidoreductase [bacterium]